jgi:hypothetical protein
MDSTTRDILTNPEVIAVDQDSARVRGEQIVGVGDLELPDADEYDVRDVWTHTTGVTTRAVSAWVPSHGATMFVVSPR